MHEVRGGEIGVIFQEPMSALNPVHRIGQQIVEALRLHKDISAKRTPWEGACELLDDGRHPRAGEAHDGLPAPALRRDAPARDDRDRARLRPDLLIADEPTTALDVTVQAQILDLMAKMQDGAGHVHHCSSPTTSA